MLAGEAARLAAIEILKPTSATTNAACPTLAGVYVFDSRAASIADYDEGMIYRPTIAVYTRETTTDRRADGYGDNGAVIVLEFVCELSQVVDDEENGGPAMTAPMAATDASARLVLAALVAQVRRLLEFGESGSLFRKAIKTVDQISEEPMVIPDFGIDLLRVTLRVRCAVQDDVFTEAAGLPQPLAKLRDALPADSYALAKLDELAAAFAGIVRTPLASVVLYDPDDPPPDGVAIAQVEGLDQ